MKKSRAASGPSERRERRRPENAAERRFVNAWVEVEADRKDSVLAQKSTWARLRRFSNTRSGRIVMLAPLGAIGAYLLLRRPKT